MQKKFDVVALGELLIDFSPHGFSPAGYPCFESNPGGAPANVLTAVSRQGGQAAFIGKVGSDYFGKLLEDALKKCAICTDGLLFDPVVKTSLAFVSLDRYGNRSFSFFRNPGADCMLTAEEIPYDLIAQGNIFHFGSLSLTHEPARTATKRAVEFATENHLFISYDPNLRLSLWQSAEEAKKQISAYLPYADILKISEEEFTFITGQCDYLTHAPAFAEKYQIACLFITLGPKGAYFRCNGHTGILPTYDVEIQDTTGSGDAFIGAALRLISKSEKKQLDFTEAELTRLVSYANASGALTTTRKGAIPAIPDSKQIEACVREMPLLK